MSLKVKLDFKGVQPQDLERRLKSGIRKAFDEVVPDLDPRVHGQDSGS